MSLNSGKRVDQHSVKSVDSTSKLIGYPVFTQARNKEPHYLFNIVSYGHI